jgi:hypothetical protein
VTVRDEVFIEFGREGDEFRVICHALKMAGSERAEKRLATNLE